MLCSYMSHWWEHGPENNQNKAECCCTSVTSEHMNTLLGNILKIIYNNLGVDEGAWMKRLAGKNKDLNALNMIFLCILSSYTEIVSRPLSFFLILSLSPSPL